MSTQHQQQRRQQLLALAPWLLFMIWFSQTRPMQGVAQEASVSLELQKQVQRSVNRLVQLQEEDGAWPYEGVYRVSGEIPVGYRVGGTSIACLALLAGDEDERTHNAIKKGIRLVLQELQHPLMKPDTANKYDVRVWGHIYALDLFCHVRQSGRFEELGEEIELWIPRLVETLVTEQIEDGGWNYAGQTSHACFVTSPAVQALLSARRAGVAVPDDVFNRAKDVLIASRTTEGAFAYSGTVGRRRAALPGSIARSAFCEATLLQLGAGDVEHLRAAIAAFYEHWEELEKRRKKTGTHKPPYGVAPYYFYYGHRYLAHAIQMLPETERPGQFQKLNKTLLGTRDEDDTWNDRVFDRSKAYGTAMSILAMTQPQLPAPIELVAEQD